jgi:hypothetical protein
MLQLSVCGSGQFETLKAVRCFAIGLERKGSYNVVRGMRSQQNWLHFSELSTSLPF